MPFLYRHKQNGKLYTIEQIFIDLRFTNGNEFAGVYAYPYKWQSEAVDPFHTDVIYHKVDCTQLYRRDAESEGRIWVYSNFDKVAELLKF